MFFMKQQAITHGRYGKEVWVPSEAQRVASMISLSSNVPGRSLLFSKEYGISSPEKQDMSNDDKEV